jgi:hypothetical protein
MEIGARMTSMAKGFMTHHISSFADLAFLRKRQKNRSPGALSFDFAQDVLEKPIMVSLSNHEFSANGSCRQHWVKEIVEEEEIFSTMDSLVRNRSESREGG